MREFHHERFKQKPDREVNWHFDSSRLRPSDFLREDEQSFSSKTAGDEATLFFKAKFDYIRDIMSDASVPGVQRMIERFLKTKQRQ